MLGCSIDDIRRTTNRDEEEGCFIAILNNKKVFIYNAYSKH